MTETRIMKQQRSKPSETALKTTLSLQTEQLRQHNRGSITLLQPKDGPFQHQLHPGCCVQGSQSV